jgi:cobalt-precorrin-6B (C15)-methyltransferase
MTDDGVDLIKRNADKFGVHINIIKGIAPGGIDSMLRFNKCFIGGSGRQMPSIFEAVDNKLESGGIIAANFVTLSNLSEFRRLLKEYDYMDNETRLVQTSSEDVSTGIMKANNPVYIVKGVKR